MKSVRELSKRQMELLLEVWDTAHRALDKSRQPFAYNVGVSDRSEWEDLQSIGYLEPIPGIEDRFILTNATDDIFDELVAAATKR